MLEHGCQLTDAVMKISRAVWFQSGQQRKNIAQLGSLGAWRQAFADFVIERYQSDRVLLRNHQVGQRGSQANSIVELGQLLVVRVSHRRAQIHHEITRDVGFRFEFLDVVFVGFGKHLPIDILEIIAVRVFSVLAEFNAETVEWTGMQAVQKPLDHKLGPQIQPFDLVDDFGFKIFFDRHVV